MSYVAVWGVSWAVLGFATHLMMRMAGVIRSQEPLTDALILSLKIGMGGVIAGAACSAYLIVAYRNRSLADIRWSRFALAGAAVAAASIAGFVQASSLLGGGKLIEWEYMNPTLLMFSGFGFIAAGLSVKLAQQPPCGDADSDPLALGEQQTSSPPALVTYASHRTSRAAHQPRRFHSETPLP